MDDLGPPAPFGPFPALPDGPQLAGQPAVYLLRHENPARPMTLISRPVTEPDGM